MSLKLTPLIALPPLCMLFFAAHSRAQTISPAPTPDEVGARINQLKIKEPLTENELLLFEENRKVEVEIKDAEKRLRALDTTELTSEAKKLETRAGAFFSAVDAVDCSKPNAEAVGKLLSDYREITNGTQRLVFMNDFEDDVADPWSDGRAANRPGATVTAGGECQQLKALAGDQASGQARRRLLQDFFNSLRQKIGQTEEENKIEAGRLNELITLLRERQKEVQQGLTKKNPQQQITDNLWLLILVIGGLSIGVLMMVKIFPVETQVEWVASGQVIQFVTVMILLCVIMALGLGNVLKENTLGTLLGGLAGYVLSQGVGRAAAREATRRLTSPATDQPAAQATPPGGG